MHIESIWQFNICIIHHHSFQNYYLAIDAYQDFQILSVQYKIYTNNFFQNLKKLLESYPSWQLVLEISSIMKTMKTIYSIFTYVRSVWHKSRNIFVLGTCKPSQHFQQNLIYIVSLISHRCIFINPYFSSHCQYLLFQLLEQFQNSRCSKTGDTLKNLSSYN